jgi:hypothetical protein
MALTIECSCAAVQMRLEGRPLLEYVCHCDDCQAAHGRAFACSVYPAAAVSVTRGEPVAFTLRSSPRLRCPRCATILYAEVPGQPVRGVNAELLPAGLFNPSFHSQCRYAREPLRDALPHYKGRPARFGGSDERMVW